MSTEPHELQSVVRSARRAAHTHALTHACVRACEQECANPHLRFAASGALYRLVRAGKKARCGYGFVREAVVCDDVGGEIIERKPYERYAIKILQKVRAPHPYCPLLRLCSNRRRGGAR